MMTPRERFLIATELKEPDQVPVAFLTSCYAPARISLSLKEYLFDRQKKMSAQIKLIERFPGCTFIPNIYADFGIVPEASSFGGEVIYFEKEPPTIKKIIKNWEDVDKLRIPDVYRDGLLPKLLEEYRYLIENTPSKYEVDPPLIRGPLDLASWLIGMGPLLSGMYENPEYVHKLMAITTEAQINLIKALEEVSGGTKILMVCDDVPGLISPKFCEEFAFPYMRKIFQTSSQKLIIYHCCKSSMHVLEGLAETGIQVFNFSFENNLAETKRRIGHRVCLLGNVEPIGIFLEASEKELEKVCKEQIKIAGPGGGYVLSVGAACYGPDKSMDALIGAANKYGKYPIAIG